MTCLAYKFVPDLGSRGQLISDDPFYVQSVVRLYVVLVGCFTSAYLVLPSATASMARFRRHWKPSYDVVLLLAVCAFLCTFIVAFGRWQFGAFDFNILTEIGWRQALGQRPYIDFVTSTPPGFNLGMKYAFKIFGVSWDANLYFSSLFACLTFLWLYWLLIRLSLARSAALGVAFAIEAAGMLTLCFWWYNDSTLILAAVFFLSSLLYAVNPESIRNRVSYTSSLSLLLLMKPNMAGVLIAGCVVLLFLHSARKRRLVLFTCIGALCAILLLLLNNVSIPAMLSSYHSVSQERGGLSRFGWREMNHFFQVSALCWYAVLSIPVVVFVREAWAQLARRAWRAVSYSLLFPLALVLALYGLATNGEYRDVECTALIAAGGVIVFGLPNTKWRLRRFYAAVLCASIAGDLYIGMVRTRVYTTGPGIFFEWHNNRERIDHGYLKNMRLSSTMIEVERQVGAVKDSSPGPYFFGPRLDFNYAVLDLPSPVHFAAWWHPGTAFGKADQPKLLQAWQAQKFQTLIFFKDDYTYYPVEFINLIKEGYTRDDRYPALTVYRSLH